MKKRLFAFFLMCLSISLVSVNVKGVSDYAYIPYTYYYWDAVEAGNNDRVTWEFYSGIYGSKDKIELRLMDSREFNDFWEWRTKTRYYELGKRLTGYVKDDSGEFRPPYSDTWYFVFHNGGTENATAIVSYEIIVHENFYILIPTVIILVIVAVSGIIGGFVYLRKSSMGSRYQKFAIPKKKEEEQKLDATILKPTPMEEPQEPEQQEPPKMTFKTCPECGTKIMNRNAKFCSNCAHEFKKEE